jgi:hypothetical protein
MKSTDESQCFFHFCLLYSLPYVSTKLVGLVSLVSHTHFRPTVFPENSALRISTPGQLLLILAV